MWLPLDNHLQPAHEPRLRPDFRPHGTSAIYVAPRARQHNRNHRLCLQQHFAKKRPTFVTAVHVFIAMANCFPRQGCNSRAWLGKVELTALLLVALLVTLCAIRSTSLGPSSRYKVKLRRSLNNSLVSTDGVDGEPFFISPVGSGSGESPHRCGVATRLFTDSINRLEDVSTHCVEAVAFSNCCQLMFVQVRMSGVYKIAGRLSYCDMETDGGGWIVILRRVGGKRSFNKNWRKYVKGFGVLDRDFWLGLDAMHQLTTEARTELRVDLRHQNGTWFYAHYSTFHVAGARDYYRLTVEGYDNRSSTTDAFKEHNGRPFSTLDNPHGPFARICADRIQAGWWYKYCGLTVLTEPYYDDEVPLGVRWRHGEWGYNERFTYVEMKVRPKSWICKGPLKNPLQSENFDIEGLL